MASSHTNQEPVTPGRKARRSWFDTPPLTHLEPLPGQHVSKRRSLDVVETLTLTHFTNPPRITFGKAVVGKTKLRTLLLRNPHDFEQEVIVERFPYKKKFMVDKTRFTVDAESTTSLEISWAPEEAGGYREMVQFHVNDVYRLQAFLIGTADKPKPPRKIRKFPLGPCIKHPPTVVQTSALSSIRNSYSPNSRQLADELLEGMQSKHQHSVEDKENSGSKRKDSHGSKEVQEGGVRKLNEVSPINEIANVTAALNPVKMQMKATTEEDGFKTPTPLESTTIVGKQEMGRECVKNRRQWRNISDITSPTLNMSPIPVNEGTEHGITVDSYFQPNESGNMALVKAEKLLEAGRNIKRNLIQRIPPKGAGKDLKDTFVIPLAPAKSMKAAPKLSAAEDNIFTVSRCESAVSTAQQEFQQQTVKANETRIIKESENLLKNSCPTGDNLALSEELPCGSICGSTEISTSQNRNHLDMNKSSEKSPPKIPRGAALFDPTQVSPRTMLDESLTLISQDLRMPFRGITASPEDKCSSINSSLISHGQGIVSPNSFMEDMRSMIQNSHCGSGDEHKNTSTPNIPSPSVILNNSIPHNIMVSHLESVRLSLHDSPIVAGSEFGTPRKLQKITFAPTRKSITSQFQKEEKKRIATVAQVFKKDQQLMGDGDKHFGNKYNAAKKQVLIAKSNVRSHNYTAGSPRRETFILKKKEAEGKKAFIRSPKGKKSILRRSPPKRRSPLSSPQDFDVKRAKNKKGKRKSSPLKAVGRTSQGKKSPSRRSDPIMPEIMSKIKGNMMMVTSEGEAVWKLVAPQKDIQLPGEQIVNLCRSLEESKHCKSIENSAEIDYYRNLPAESKEIGEIMNENTPGKKIKLFPDLYELNCYETEECLLVKDNETKKTISDIDGKADGDKVKTRGQEIICKTGYEHKLCVGEIEPSENNVTETYSRSQAEREVPGAERVVPGAETELSAQRFCTLSPSNLPASPEVHLDQSRRGTITVTKSRPSDALLKAMNNRKRLFHDSPQKTPYSVTDDDTETQENISVKFEERYQEIDGKMYVFVKETTDVIKSTTETYVEQVTLSPQQFDTPVKLPNSPEVLVSRRSTHVVRSPKVFNFDSMNRRQLDFADKVEVNIVQDKNLVKKKVLGNDKELNSSELSENNCSAIKSDTFEKEPSFHISTNTHDIFTDNSEAVITSVCAISRRLVSYDDGSETCSTASVTKDSLDTTQSLDSLGCSFNEANASLEERTAVDQEMIDKEDQPFVMDAEESIIELNWEVMVKESSNVKFNEKNQDMKNFSRGNGRYLAAADEESEDEQFYDTMSETYYDAMSDTGNPEVVQLDEIKETVMFFKYPGSTIAEFGKNPADSCFGISSDYLCDAEDRPECSVMSGGLSAGPSMDTCVPLREASAMMQSNYDEHTVRNELSVDHREMFVVVERKVINLCSVAELQLVEEVVRSTPEAKAKRKLRRSASASDLLERQEVSDAAESPNLSVSKTTTPRKVMTSSQSAVFRSCAGQLLAKFSPKNVFKNQPSPNKTTQVTLKQRSQSMSNLAKQADRARSVRMEQHTSTTNRTTRQANQGTKPASKQKSLKGVAQSKLILVKKSKTGAPRHPMLFAAKNMYYDERWMEKQERGFVQWLNFVLTPPDEYAAVVNKAKVDARSLALDVDHVTPRLAPTKEILSFRAYGARRRLNRLRRGACELYQSGTIVAVIRKIEVEVESRRICARKDKMMHADVGIKQRLLDLLLHYSPLWLRIGLETIFGEVLMLQSNQDVMGLSRFIVTRLLASPDIAAEFAHPTVPHLYKEGYVDSVSRHTVKKFLLLVYFLDQAKLGHLIDHDPCLFCKDDGIKSSKEILIEFSREVLSGEGDITRHLAYLGYTVSHTQKPIDEFDFAVANLSSDLRDGLRLCRVLEFLTGDHNIMTKLRTPAISRLQKIHNTELFFKALHKQGLDFSLMPGTVTARDVVDGHREKTLTLLWQLIIHFQSSVLVNETHLKEEIDILMKSLRLKIAMQKIGALSIEDCQARRDSGEPKLIMENQRLHLIFQWCRLVCLHYGLKIENFTVSFSDGRALCCLIHHYHPALLPLAEIRFETTISLQENAEDRYQQDIEDSMDRGHFDGDSDENNPEVFERLLANEKSNYKTLYEKASALGGVPLMLKSADMSNTIPDEKVVSIFVSYLCARLLDIREEVKAARIIQMAWRRKQLRKIFLEKQRKTKAAVTIQDWFRSLLAKILKAKETEIQAAVHIQAAWRAHTARLYVARLKEMIQEGEQGDHKVFPQVTSKCQRLLQTQLIEHYHKILLKQQKMQESTRRREEEAAITIQKHVRRFHCLQEFKRQQESVIKIQALWRKQLARKLLCKLKKEQIENAAVVIQKWIKMHICLIQYRKTRNAVISIQKCWRMRQSRRTLKTLRTEKYSRAATTIQKHVKARLEQKKFQKIKQAAVVVQGYWKIKQAKKELAKLKSDRENKAGILVQNYMKAIICRQKYIRLRNATRLLQKRWRQILAQRKLITLKADRDNKAAVVIQKYFKSYKAQQQFRAQQKSVILIQSMYRMLQAKRELLELRKKKQENQAAIVIQKHFKGYKAQKLYRSQQKSATLIQSMWRMLQAKRELLQFKQKKKEENVKAAIVIQKYFKCYQAQKQFRAEKKSVILIQSMWRMLQAKRELLELRQKKQENQAAIVIQKHFKGYKAQKHFHSQRKSAILIQSVWRMLQAKRQLLELKQKKTEEENQAAIVIQKLFKGYQAQQRYHALQKSAVLIQSMWRMLQAKREFFKLKQKKREENQAAIMIQKYFKGYKTQKHFHSQQKSAILIQSMWRMFQAKKELLSLKQKQQESSATLIQCYYRRFKCRQEYQKYRHAAITIQKTWRMLSARNVLRKYRLENQIQAGTKIQRIYRGFIQRRSYIRLKFAAVIVQKWWRMVLAKKLSKRLKRQQQENAALVLQRNFKMWMCRRYFLKLKSAAVVLQTTWKMVRDRRLFLTLRSMMQERSALCIQKVWRGHVTRQILASRRRAALVIQSWWKMTHQKQQFWRMKEAATLIQTWYRAAVLSKHQRSVFLNLRTSAIHIQRWWRSQVLRRKFQTMRLSAVIIQAHYRSYIRGLEVRKEYLTLRSATVTIQKNFRRYLHTRNEKRTAAALVLQTMFRKMQAQRKYIEQKIAAETIQNYFRGYKKTRDARQQFLHQKQAAQVIQKYLREYLKIRAIRQQFLHQKHAAETIQKFFRGYQKIRVVRQQFLHQKQAASIIQMTFRAFLIRRQYLLVHQSVIKIQAHIKGRIIRKRFQKLQRAAVTIQVHFRAVRLSKIHHEAFLQLKTSAIVIQRFYRTAVAERRALKEVDRRHAAATRIQAIYRGWHQNNKYLLLQAATVMIQQWYRSYLAGKAVRAQMVRMRQAAVVIQKRFRLYKQLQEANRQKEKLRAAKQNEIIRKLEEARFNAKEVSVGNTGVGGREEKWDIKVVVSVVGAVDERRREEKCDSSREQRVGNAGVESRTEEGCDISREQNVGNAGVESRTEEKWDITGEVSVGNFEVDSRIEENCDSSREQNYGNAGVESRTEEKWDIKGEVSVRNFEVDSKIEENCDSSREQSVGNAGVESRTEEKCDISREQSVGNVGIENRVEEKCDIKVDMSVGNAEDENRTEKKCDISREQSVGNAENDNASKEKWNVSKEQRVGNAGVKSRREEKCDIKQRVCNAGVVSGTEEKCDVSREHCVGNAKIESRVEKKWDIKGDMSVKDDESWTDKRCHIKGEVNVGNAGVDRRSGERREHAAVITIQEAVYQTRIENSEELAIRNYAARVIQNRWRQVITRRHCQKELTAKHEAAIVIQTYFRMKSQRQRYQDNLQLVVALQACIRTFVQKHRYKESVKQVVKLQRRVRSLQQMRKIKKQYLKLRQVDVTDQTSVSAEFTRRCQHPEECVLKIQLLQQQLDASSQELEASNAKKEFLEMKWQWLDNKEAVLATKSSENTYLSCETRTRHLAPVDSNCTGQRFEDTSWQEKNTSAVVIQRAVRRFMWKRNMIKTQCIVAIQTNIRQYLGRRHFLAKLQSVVILQAAVRRWLARRLVADLRKRHHAAICLQAHVRAYLVRKTFLTPLQDKILSMRNQKKENGAAIIIQATWRGFITRKKTKDRKLTLARKRLKEANKQATEERTLGSRTSSALDFLLREKDVGHILEALMHLEVCTRLSPICCERMAEVNAVPGLYRLISSCNRSVPHMELIKYSVSILLNLAKYEKTISAVLEPEDSVATILELLQIYREKGAIFNYCCMLLGILGLHPGRRAIILKNPLIVDRLQSIHTLSLRKHRMNRNRQVTQAKMAALRSFNCTLPVLPSKWKHRRIRPEWALAGDTIKDFDDPVTAVTFVMDSLQIGPKM